MAEYVEKAAFREHLDSVPPFTKDGQRDPKYDFAKTIFLSELAAYPAADVTSVRHGRWRFDDFDGDGLDYQCSWCRGYQRKASNYCPDCGAKMDEEKTE